jgi:HNH endonuclease
LFCIFCKDNTSTSRSVEHVIPESLGNTTLKLPPGVVCDRCNNYFAVKIEKPLLESAEIIALRFHERIPSKKKIIPPMMGILGPKAPVVVQPYLEGPVVASVYASPEALDLLFNHNADVINIPEFGDSWDEALTSRFLAKVALEAMAVRLVRYAGGTAYLASEPQLIPSGILHVEGDGVHGRTIAVESIQQIKCGQCPTAARFSEYTNRKFCIPIRASIILY